jgi:Fe-S cluster assembly iron-binding protein IscA
MALDEPRDNDKVFDIDGFQFLVDKDFLEKAQPIKVDFLVHGFKLDCGLDFGAGGCSSCGSGSCG